MTTEQTLILLVLAAALVLFVQGRLRHDVVAFGALCTAAILGVVPEDRVLSGFGHPAVFTVAAVLILSRSVQISGVLDPVARALGRGDRSEARIQVSLVVLATALSMFMNNVGALALVMPLAGEVCSRTGMSPSRVLMPIAFGSILGGTTTLIGTPPNLVIATYRNETAAGEPFSMFAFAPVGLLISMLGLLVILKLSPKLVPQRHGSLASGSGDSASTPFLSELHVPHHSPVIGQTIVDLTDATERDLEVLGMIRSEVPIYHSVDHLPLRPGDVVLLRAASETLVRLARGTGFELRTPDDQRLPSSADVGTLQFVVPVGSRFVGRTPANLRLHTRMGVNLLAIGRRGRPVVDRLADLTIHAGDVLMMQGNIERVGETAQTYGLMPLAGEGFRVTRPSNRYTTLLVFVCAVLATALTSLPVHVAFGSAVTALVLLRCVTIRQLYEAVDWSVVVMLAGLIPIGEALRTSGATDVLSGSLSTGLEGAPLLASLFTVFGVTTLMTNVLNNAATAVVMAPLAAALSTDLGHSTDAYLMTVAIGSSCAFLTPIGHQNNVLVLGPGGYRFGDYLRLGLPVTLITGLVGVPVIAAIF